MWPFRRRAPADAEGEPAAKRSRTAAGSSSSSAAATETAQHGIEGALANDKLRELQEVQLQLQYLDEQCAEEQIAIQRRFDKLRRPFFERRSKLLRQVPGFWQAALSGHPSGLVHPEEADALDQVTDLDVRENLDDSCSYEVRFLFGHNAKDNRSRSSALGPRLFQEKLAVKRVAFQDGQGDPATVQPARLTPAGERGAALLSAVARGVPSSKGQGPAASSSVSPPSRSVLGWLLSKAQPDAGGDDLGDILRRDLWQDPLPYFLEGQHKVQARASSL
eukprot:TRINITY_DN28449_c0_g1_i1.p1 TRINITY_DN28449_c0_g1~~TRINITY_DN28449_c0_g1_i1.p1  ORF type:complete len:277 (-),score=56.83 TRINITY_DN28449_c0_g1_i1:45-875(-)